MLGLLCKIVSVLAFAVMPLAQVNTVDLTYRDTSCNISALVYSNTNNSFANTFDLLARTIGCNVQLSTSSNDAIFSKEGGAPTIYIVNPTLRVCLSQNHQLSQLANLVTPIAVSEGPDMNPLKVPEYSPNSLLAGIMFSRIERTDLNTAPDFIGKKISVIQFPSIGGLLLPIYELKKNGVNMLLDSFVVFRITPAQVIDDVLQNRSDIGCVFSTYFDSTTFGPFKMLLARKYPQYPIDTSTSLVPSSSILTVADVFPIEVVRRIGATLYTVADNSQNETLKAAAVGDKYSYWTPPMTDTTVAEVLRDIGVLLDNGTCQTGAGFYDALTCPEHYTKISQQASRLKCSQIGLSCGDNTLCICKPCLPNTTHMKTSTIVIIVLVVIVFVVVVCAIVLVLHSRNKQRKQAASMDKPMYLTSQATRIFPDANPKVHFMIGSGSFGEVYKGLWNNQVVVFKVTKINTTTADANSLWEGSLAKSFEHANIVKTLDYGIHIHSLKRKSVDRHSLEKARSLDLDSFGPEQLEVPDDLWLVLEYCDGGCLKDYINIRRGAKPDLKRIKTMLLEIAEGMSYLHKVSCIHGDLNSNNVLISDGVCKVADFGLMRLTTTWTQTFKSTAAFGTLTHMAPELLNSGQLSFQVDVYAFGMLAWELLHGTAAFKDVPPAMVGSTIMSGGRPDIDSALPGHWKLLVKTCWVQSAKRRPSWEEIIETLSHIDV